NIKIFRYVCRLILDELTPAFGDSETPNNDNALLNFFKTVRHIDYCYWGVSTCGTITYDEKDYKLYKEKEEGSNMSGRKSIQQRQANLLFLTQKVVDTVFLGCDGVI